MSFPELIPYPSSIINPFPQEENPSIVLHAALLEKDKRTTLITNSNIYIYILELVIRAVLLSFPELIPNPSSIINPFPQEENPSIVLHAAILEKDKRTNGTDSLQNHTKPLTLIVPK